VEKRHIEVPTHVRNLPVGQKASPLKLEQAAEMGYDLEANQTWVIDYAYEKVA